MRMMIHMMTGNSARNRSGVSSRFTKMILLRTCEVFSFSNEPLVLQRSKYMSEVFRSSQNHLVACATRHDLFRELPRLCNGQ